MSLATTIDKQKTPPRFTRRGTGSVPVLNRETSLRGHFPGVIRTEAVAHQLPDVALPALLSSAAGFSDAGRPGADEGACRTMFRRAIHADCQRWQRGEVSVQLPPGDHFGEIKVRTFKGGMEIRATTNGGPVGIREAEGEGGDVFHTQFEFLVSSNRLVGKRAKRLRRREATLPGFSVNLFFAHEN